MKLAYFSPLGPQRSGISDYSEELLPWLAEGAEITLFVDGFQPSNRELTSRFEVRNYRRQRSCLRELDGFDAVVYHMGNDHRYHAGILEAMQRRRGIVVFHDFALQDFYLGLARERNDLRIYLDEVESCHGMAARTEAAAALDRGAAPAILSQPINFPLNCRLATAAEGIIVHSEWCRVRFAKIAPGVPLARIPMPVHFVDDVHQHSETHSEVRIASFGLITPGKGIEQALRALSTIKQTHRFRYTLVGEPNTFFDVRELIRRYGMDGRVEITGHVSLEEFKRRMAETDIALNLRERTVGETSASLVRLFAAGVCSVVAEVGWYGELPNEAVVKVLLDAYTDKLLVAYLTRLIEDEPLRRQIGENAKTYARTEHDVKHGAAAYLDFIRSVLDGRVRRQLLSGVSEEVRRLGITAADESVLRSVAAEFAGIVPEKISPVEPATSSNGNETPAAALSQGRVAKVEGIDYKRAAIEYLGRLNEERRHHLRTKPFYNLANKPAKYKGEGIDEDMHRHFCDFANIAMTLALPPGSRILDVGCGSGWLSEYFARLGYTVKGIDISPDLIRMSEERVARVPYGADHETPLRCTFQVHDIERAALDEKFDAVICYDSLHHLEDEHAVMCHLAAMLSIGGVLFILEGDRPPSGSASETELYDVMSEFGTLESPFDYGHLRQLLEDNGFFITGDYVSVNGLFERELIVDDLLPLKSVPTNYHYLACKKVAEGAPAATIPDSRDPRTLRARISLSQPATTVIAPGLTLNVELEIENAGDTLWLAGREAHTGIVMPAVRVIDANGILIRETHGEPPLPHAVAPGETVRVKLECQAPQRPGRYTLKFDLVDEQICWFEATGSAPLTFQFEVGE
jgi:SAM-dependent methyltransferase/glycosyltransferase involved in cell wall biosynthesis